MRAALVTIGLLGCSGKATPTPAAPVPVPVAAPVTPAAPSAAPVAPAAPAAPSPATTANVSKVTLADVGLEASSLDRTADPCVDFYQFACGGWLANNKIPDDRARWARFSEIEEKNLAALRALLEEAAKGIGVDAQGKKLGDYYAACMDEAAIEKGGTAPIKALLAKTRNVKDARAWLVAVEELHKLGANVVWSVSSGADSKASTMTVTKLDAAGLGLPDRDYYLKPDFKEQVVAYKQHVAAMLGLVGGPAWAPAKTEGAANDVVAIETAIAGATKTRVERRDRKAAYNPTTIKDLGKSARSVDWAGYFKALGFAPSARLVVGTPPFFAKLDALRARFTAAQWASYFTYHLVEALAFALPKAFDEEAFALQKALTGQPVQQERYKRCIESTERGLGELLGQQYAAKYFPSSAKQTATQLVDAIVQAMGGELAGLPWMSAATKQIAQGKLAKIVRMVGYPDKWRSYDFDVKRDDFAGDDLRARAFEKRRQLAKSGKPVDRGEWQMNSYTVNAYYEPSANSTALPAGILQPPFFGPDRAVAVNLGGIGMVIGHELTHGFDDQGAKFDSDGNLDDWWQPDDKKKFDDKASCVADQYSTFEAAPKAFVQGKLTLGENIADLGGVKMAFEAYRTLRKDAPTVNLADGFTEDQQFFLAVGQAWCSKDRAAEIQRRLTIDLHSPPKFRVYGALRNLHEFSDAFSCAPGTPMRPANTCQVW